MDAAMRIFELTKSFPAEEKYSMVDQNATLFALGLHEYRRSLAQETLCGALH
jgi:hypothetical protein